MQSEPCRANRWKVFLPSRQRKSSDMHCGIGGLTPHVEHRLRLEHARLSWDGPPARPTADEETRTKANWPGSQFYLHVSGASCQYDPSRLLNERIDAKHQDVGRRDC